MTKKQLLFSDRTDETYCLLCAKPADYQQLTQISEIRTEIINSEKDYFTSPHLSDDLWLFNYQSWEVDRVRPYSAIIERLRQGNRSAFVSVTIWLSYYEYFDATFLIRRNGGKTEKTYTSSTWGKS